MKKINIEIDKKDYEILLKHLVVWDWVYWLMSDAVDAKYKREVNMWDKLVDKVLSCTNDKNIKTTFNWKNVFTDKFINSIAFTDITNYDNYVVEDLTGIDMLEIEQNIENAENNPLFMK